MAIITPTVHAELPEDVAARVRAVTEQMNFYEKQVAEKREALKLLNDEYFGLQVLNAELKKKEEEMTKTLLEVQNRIQTANKELSAVQASKTRVEADSETTREALSELRKEVDAQKQSLELATKELEAAKKSTEEEKAKQSSLRAHLEEIRKCISEVSSKLMDI